MDADEYEGAIIDYQLTRGDSIQTASNQDLRRTGTFTLALGESEHSMTEDFMELTNPTGVVFTTDQVGSVTAIEYTLSNLEFDGVFSYSIRHLTCKIAVPPTP